MANQDIFKMSTEWGDAWQLNGAIVTIPDSGDLIATGITIQYNRQISKFVPINSGKTYMIGGRGNGQMSIQSIIGPADTIVTFLGRYGDICKKDAETANTIIITPMGPNCDKPGEERIKLKCSHCFLLGVNFQVQDLGNEVKAVTSQMNLMFNSFNTDPEPQFAAAAAAAAGAGAAVVA